jgi:hypothetical protein
MKLGFSSQVDAVERALATAYRLMPFAKLLSIPEKV